MNSFNMHPWDDEADGVFFAVTATLFAPSYTYGASVLLASYDAEDEEITPSSVASAGDAQAPITVTTEVVVSWTRPAQRRWAPVPSRITQSPGIRRLRT